MTTFANLVRPYRDAFQEEPKLRSYALTSFVDDLGIAVSTWAMMLLMTNLFVTQRARASLMLPTLLCFLVGTIVSGPLADWAGRHSMLRLARWRWRVVVWSRLLETLMLGVLVFELALGPPTILRILPFAMVAAFSKTAFRPARTAFMVDLLRKKTPQVDVDGRPLVDEQGQPLEYKTHLLAVTSLLRALAAGAAMTGLVFGGRILTLTSGRYWPLFLVDVILHVVVVVVLFLSCHPTRSWGEARLRELVSDVGDENDVVEPGPRPATPGVARRFAGSLVDGARFLLRRDQRPLLVLLAGGVLVELVTESYDGKMMIKHVLSGRDSDVRHAEIAWSLVGLIGVAVAPALTRATGSIGKVFLVTMLLDGAAIAFAGHLASSGRASAIAPFTIVLAVDHTLTLVSGSLVDLAQSSASSAAMRGRVLGTLGFIVIIGDIVVQIVATAVSEAIGISAMLVRVGLVQVAIVALLAVAGGGRLWRFGLRSDARVASASPLAEAA